ncbi:hypothetical protein BC943DRAFT_276208 [Umbelopsis sp. AD052]|nr:hypothetical protein BC943DRAFT_276208 [Umbelopsis sp. AD052]
MQTNKTNTEADSKNAEGSKKARFKKGPNAPQHSLSAYMFYYQAERKIIEGRNPEAVLGQIEKMLGEQWMATSEHDIAIFFAKAEADLKHYKRKGCFTMA